MKKKNSPPRKGVISEPTPKSLIRSKPICAFSSLPELSNVSSDDICSLGVNMAPSERTGLPFMHFNFFNYFYPLFFKAMLGLEFSTLIPKVPSNQNLIVCCLSNL
jgi:hypothetical protein